MSTDKDEKNSGRLENPTRAQYKRMVKLMREVSSHFDAENGYDLREMPNWSNARKAAVTKKFREYTDFVTDFRQDVMPTRRLRSKKKKQAVKEWAGVDYPKFIDKAVMVPRFSVADKEPPKIELKGDKVVFRRGLVGFTWYGFDKEDLVQNPEDQIAEAVEGLENAGSRSYAIRNGENRMRAKPLDYEIMLQEILDLMNKYSDEDYSPDDPNSHYFGNWLNGVEGFVPSVGMGYRAKSPEGRAVLERDYTKQRARDNRRAAKRRFERLTGTKYKRKKDE